MRLLLTRPQEDSEALAARLREMGHVPVLAPVMEIRPRSGVTLDLDGIQGILVTSRNGLAALAALTPRRDLPLYAVGPASAAAAEAAGFAPVFAATGDVEALATLAGRACRPEAGALLHVAGSAQAGDLAGALTAQGFSVRRQILYDSLPMESLPEAARAALSAGTLDGVLFYSPRTARLFGELAEKAGLTPALRRLTAYCLSPAVAKATAPSPYGALAIAPAPREAALLALIQT
jgi:uroporphyrinogen-III synthase